MDESSTAGERPSRMLGPLSGWMRRLYDWVLGWADSPYSGWALFGIAVAESSFFPLPPDLLLIPLAVSVPARALRYAGICTVGSVLGGALGYLIGLHFFDLVGAPIVRLYGYEDLYVQAQELYRQYDALAIGVAGLTPIPYKLATITAGFFNVNFGRFIVVSVVARSLRFFVIGGLIRMFGPTIKTLIDRYFDLLSVVFLILLVAGFIVLRWVF